MDLYAAAAEALDKFAQKQGSVKSLVFASQFKNIRQLYALVCESLKYQTVLQSILHHCAQLQKEEAFVHQPHLATVLLYEHLLGKGLGRAGRIRSNILRHKQEVNTACSALLQENGVESLGDLLSEQCQTFNKLAIPRYARVNLLKTTVDDAIKAFEEEGWVWKGKLDLHRFAEGVGSLGEDGFAGDPLLPDLLVFPPSTDFHDHPAALSSSIVLQDRASCFPAHVLAPPEGAAVLDCCAAPGNKTTHTASLLGNSGKIIAYERDAKRMGLLKQQLKKAGVTNTRTVHADFLSVDPHDPALADVQYILVDPSCSGSGIISRMDHVGDGTTSTSESSQRLQSLARFQISILKHALQFPSVRRVVYSTCSMHQEENENVVSEVAAQCQGTFSVSKIFPEWPHRGVGESEVAECCLRMSPENDLTNGFFVACFSRVEEGAFDSPLNNGVQEQVNGAQRKRKRKTKDGEVHVDEGKKKRKFTEENGPVNEGGCLSDGRSTSHATSMDKNRRVQIPKDLSSSVPIHAGRVTKAASGDKLELSSNAGIPGLNSPNDAERPLKVKKKKKKKKEGKENLASSAVTASDCITAEAAFSSEEEHEEERPKKSRKKKKKAEKEREGIALTPASIAVGSSVISTNFPTASDAFIGPDEQLLRPLKQKKKKRKVEKETEIVAPSSSAITRGSSQTTADFPATQTGWMDIDYPSDGHMKKKKKKKKKRATGDEIETPLPSCPKQKKKKKKKLEM